jgi:hypothetical protein
LSEGRIELLKKFIHVVEDFFPVVLALIFVVAIILTVCHATSSLQDATKKTSLPVQTDRICVQKEQPKADDNIENAVRSGELEMLVSPIVP